MGQKRNRYEGNKKIAEDDATYPDHRTIDFINIVADLAVELTLAKMQPHQYDPPPNWLKDAKRLKKRTRRKGKNSSDPE